MDLLTHVVSTPLLNAFDHTIDRTPLSEAIKNNPSRFFMLGTLAVGIPWLIAVLWTKCAPCLCPTPSESAQYLQDLNGRVKSFESYPEATRAAQKHIQHRDPFVRFCALLLFHTLVEQSHTPAYDPALTVALKEPPPPERLPRNAMNFETPNMDHLYRARVAVLVRALVSEHHTSSYGPALQFAQARINSRNEALRTGAYFIVFELIKAKHEPAYTVGLELAQAMRTSTDAVLRRRAYELMDQLLQDGRYLLSYQPAIEFVTGIDADTMDVGLRMWETLMNRGYTSLYPHACTLATQFIDHKEEEPRHQAARCLRDLVLDEYTASYELARKAVQQLGQSEKRKDRALADDLLRALILRGENRDLEIEERAAGAGLEE